MPIPATATTTVLIPPIPTGQVALNNWAIQSFTAVGTGNPGNPSTGAVKLRKWGTDANGTVYENPQSPTEYTMMIPDYYALAATEPLTEAALGLLTLAVCVHAASISGSGSGVGTGPAGTIQAAVTALANQLLSLAPNLKSSAGVDL